MNLDPLVNDLFELGKNYHEAHGNLRNVRNGLADALGQMAGHAQNDAGQVILSDPGFIAKKAGLLAFASACSQAAVKIFELPIA